jgi:anti-sigma regulatory factor (Ser/Thr protein kinase)
MVAKIDVRLAPEPENVTTARHALDRLANFMPSEKLEDIRLVVSELVTNSVLHVIRAAASGYLRSLARGPT